MCAASVSVYASLSVSQTHGMLFIDFSPQPAQYLPIETKAPKLVTTVTASGMEFLVVAFFAI